MSKSLKKLIDINRLREFKNKLVGAGSAYVQTAAVDQTVGGTKTFSKPIVGSVTGSSGSCTGNSASATKATQDAAGNTITTTYATKAENNTKANDSEVVHKSGDETIAGTKTFSNGVLSTTSNAFMAQSGGYTLLIRIDSKNAYLLMSDKDGVPGSFSSARPLTISNSTGVCNINGNAATATTATTAKACTGNAATATKATGNANGKELTNTIIKGLSISGKTITYTQIDGNTGTLTTQDTVYTHPTTAGNKHIPSGGSSGQFLGWASDGTAKWVNNPNTNTDTLMTQNVSTTNATYPVLLVATADATANQGAKTGIFAKSVKVNPSTNVISASGFSGPLTGNVTGNCSGSSGSCTGNAASATKLQTARTINGTSFNGTANITTANWGTARNITITDGTNTSTAVSVNGSANVALKLPSTIKATFVGNVTGNVTGNCSGSSGSCTGNAATATNAGNGVDSGGSGWIRFKNGIQICVGGTSSVKLKPGEMNTASATFPKSFNNIPEVITCSANPHIIAATWNVQTTSCDAFMKNTSPGDIIGIGHYIAFGTWK